MEISLAIDEYIACKRNKLTSDSRQWYKWLLGKFEQWCRVRDLMDLGQITPRLVQEFIADNPDHSSNTRHHRAQVVKGFLRWCAADDDMGVRQKTVDRIEMPKVVLPEVAIYSEDEVKRLLLACEQTRHFLRNRAIILLLLDTGVRVAELCYDNTRPEEQTGLRLEDVVIGAEGTDSYITVMGKGWKSRTLKMGKETCSALHAYLTYARPHTQHSYAFVGRNAEPLTVHGVQTILTNVGRWGKVENVYPHRFRHTFAINQLLAGTPSLVLMTLMGHTTLESTKTYTRALTQLHARQASISVVDTLWEKVQPDQVALIRQSITKKRQQKGAKAQAPKRTKTVFHREDGGSVVLKRNRDPKPVYAQWSLFFRIWQERCSITRLGTSQVWKLLSDVLPESVRPQEGEHPKAFLYRLRTALQERCGVSYGESPITLRCWPAVKRGMNEWGLSQISPAR
ncbi:MAG TPA: tyrosine-type recombinase/integrase [Ktedonobacteraceae bacterium]|nr:tyrosine-type recombinase/integrase [Ktedonobacteraceae bacterium]